MDIESCFWVITVIVMLMVMPNLEKLVLDKGQITLPSDLESVIGTELLNDIQNEGRIPIRLSMYFIKKRV